MLRPRAQGSCKYQRCPWTFADPRTVVVSQQPRSRGHVHAIVTPSCELTPRFPTSDLARPVAYRQAEQRFPKTERPQCVPATRGVLDASPHRVRQQMRATCSKTFLPGLPFLPSYLSSWIAIRALPLRFVLSNFISLLGCGFARPGEEAGTGLQAVRDGFEPFSRARSSRFVLGAPAIAGAIRGYPRISSVRSSPSGGFAAYRTTFARSSRTIASFATSLALGNRTAFSARPCP